MADEILTVSDIATQHAAKLKESSEGATTETKVTTQETTTEKNTDPPAPNPLDDLLKEYNLESIDDLKSRLKPKEEGKVESPEEKEKRENLYRVEMQKYAVETGQMKPDDFVKLENLKAKDDRALVYESWLPSWKEENPGVDPADADRQAQADFESEYRLNSENEKTKNRGLSKITKEAKEIRKPLESAYDKVKGDFDEDRTVKSDYPDFNKKVSGFIQEHIPAKVKLFETKDGEESVPVEIELTDDQRKAVYAAVSKKIMNAGTYQMYKKGDLKGLQELAKKEAEATIWNDQREAGLTKIAETFLKRGDEKGYKRGVIGAKQPFPLVKDGKNNGGPDTMTAAQEILNQPAFKGTR